MYENVNDDGFYPICCGFGIPMGTGSFTFIHISYLSLIF